MRLRSMRSGSARRAVSLAGILVSLALRPAPVSATPAFGWRELAPPLRSGHSAVYDALRDRMIIYGGGSERMWSLALATGRWTEFEVQGPRPPSRAHQSAVYDPVRDRLILFGGDGKNDVWALNLQVSPATWTQIVTAGTPPPTTRTGNVAIYDPARDRLVVFCGNGGRPTALAALYALPLSGPATWSTLLRSGTLPAGRASENVVYDGARDRLVVFGGATAGDGVGSYSDVWAIGLGDTAPWQQLSPGGSFSDPDARSNATAAWDGGDRLLVCGGYSLTFVHGAYLGDAWSFDLGGNGGWTQIASLYGGIPGRAKAAGVFDPLRWRMIVHGGENFGEALDDTWSVATDVAPALSLVNSRGSSEPFGIMDQAAICDPVGNRMITFGGRYDNSTSATNEAYSLSLPYGDAWTKLSPPPLDGCTGFGATAIDDPLRSRMLVFGWLTGPCAANTVLSLALAGTPAWTDLAVGGTAPSARRYHSAIYDPNGDRMLVYGGQTADSVASDLWSLSLSGTPTWTRIDAPGTRPPATAVHSAVYDAARNRMLVLNGPNVWALSLDGTPTWTAYTPAGTGPTVSRNSIYEPTTGLVMVVESGSTLSVLDPSGTTAWMPVTVAGLPPVSRFYDACVFDPNSGRMMLTGGIIPGQLGSVLPMHDLWAIQVVPGSLVGVAPEPCAVGLRLAGANPARHDVRLSLNLPRSAHVVLGIHDPMGRRIRSIDEGALSAGVHPLIWDAKDSVGRRAPAGIYFVRVDAGGDVFTRRVVVLD